MDAVHRQHAEDEVVQREQTGFDSAHGVGLILLAAAIALAPLATTRFGFRGFVAIYAVATLLWLALRRVDVSLPTTLILGIALRALFLVPDPALSGDVFRYLSDGRHMASWHNPYTYTPDDLRINHREIRSIYPPLAQLFFMTIGYARPGIALLVWRLILLAADVACIVLLRRHARAAFAFAICPLVIFEGVWNGHIDALAAVFLGFALARCSGFFAALAAGLKIIPLAAVPALFPKKRPFSFYFFLALPFYFFLGGPIMPGFREYATRWIFNSPLYDATRAIAERIPTKEIWTHHPLRFELISDVVYRHLYPDFITRAVLATLAIGGILLARRVTTAVSALLVCSPAIHPWYWLTIVPTALMEGAPALLLFALCAPFSYLLYDGVHPLIVYALCYGIPLVTLWRD